jgi:hypothetical protein
MGADIHMVLEKRITQTRGTDTATVWVGVNAFPYVVGEIMDTTLRDKDPAGDMPYLFVGNVHWQATSRNYELFGALAGVRREGPPPRGLPQDVSVLALHMVENWGEDGHSHTWMTMDEALPAFIQNGQFGRIEEAVTHAIVKGDIEGTLRRYMHHFWSMDSETESLSDYRLIIWFDN